MAQNKEKPADIVKSYIADNDLTQGKIVNGSIVGTLAQQLISIHDKGFDIFTIVNQAVKTVDSYLWSDFSAAKIDKMALSVRLDLTGNKSVHIHVPELKGALDHLQENNISASYIKRIDIVKFSVSGREKSGK